MRAAGTEIRQADLRGRHAAPREPSRNLLAAICGKPDALRDGQRDLERVHLTALRQQWLAVLVPLADDAHHAARAPVVQNHLDLVLDQRTFVLDDHDRGQPTQKFQQLLWLERPHHRGLVDTQADGHQVLISESEFAQRKPKLLIGTSRRDDPEPADPIPGAHHADAAIDARCACKRHGRRQLDRLGAGFHRIWSFRPAQVHTVGRQREIARRRKTECRIGQRNLRRRFADRAGELEADPGSAIARQRPAEQSQRQDVLDV